MANRREPTSRPAAIHPRAKFLILIGTQPSGTLFRMMQEDPLFQRAEQAIRECAITRKQASENLQKARLAAIRVRDTLRILREKPNYRFDMEILDLRGPPESPEANRIVSCGGEKTSE